MHSLELYLHQKETTHLEKNIFLPLEKMMRFKLYSLMKESFQKHLLASWEEFLQNQFEDIFPLKNEIISTPLPLQSTLHHQPIKKN
jgi:hypothetical protein